MPISNAVKGLQNIKSMRHTTKSGIPNKEDSDFIKLYMYEKERTRLKSEETKILLRLEIIRDRLKVIQEYNEEKATEMATTGEKPENQKDKTKDDAEFKTLSIEY